MSDIQLKNVTKRYRQKTAISSLTLDIPDKSMTGLVGPNGAGKTTLLNMIAGFEKTTDGELTVFGEEPFDHLNVAANLFYVHDGMMYPQDFRIADVFRAFQTNYPHWDQALAEQLAQHFGLDIRQMPRYLSKGQASTLNAVIGLAVHTPVTLFDEPTTGMDYGVRRDFYRALLKSYLATPRTIVLSSHLLNELEDLLEHVVLINRGELVLQTEMDDLKHYAVGVSGTEEQLNGLENVLYQESLGFNQHFWVIEHPGESDLNRLREQGLSVAPVAPADLCVYLTQTGKGDIDDVF
ncbi:ABC-2 type transport system ATP-binding protein [Alkalibacillus flavidus]|uniref:ABC-2 type transport system ATP-binding protein n=1 Tax=Alkalibacillus flavidus TaxID=546021 RepID=A0ABV2KWY9_9BACI